MIFQVTTSFQCNVYGSNVWWVKMWQFLTYPWPFHAISIFPSNFVSDELSILSFGIPCKSIQTTAIESHGSGPIPPNCWTTDGLWRVRQKPTSIRIFLTTAATEDFRDPKDAAIWGQLLQRIFLLGPDSSHFYPLLYVTNSPPGKHSESNQSVQCCQDAEERRRNRCCSYLGLTESPLSLWGTEGMPGWRHHAHFITLKHTKKILWYLCLMDMFPSLSESEVMTDTSGYNNHPWPKFAWIKIYCNYMYLLDMSM